MVKSNIPIVGPRVRFPAGAFILLLLSYPLYQFCTILLSSSCEMICFHSKHPLFFILRWIYHTLLLTMHIIYHKFHYKLLEYPSNSCTWMEHIAVVARKKVSIVMPCGTTIHIHFKINKIIMDNYSFWNIWYFPIPCYPLWLFRHIRRSNMQSFRR